jgi:hypothetical protein
MKTYQVFSMRRPSLWKATLSIALCGFLLPGPRLVAGPRDAWVATWATSPEPADADASEPLLNVENQTVRERVRVSIGGPEIRLRLSNEFGSAPLLIGSVTVALPNGPARIQSASVRTVAFDGRNSVSIPAGAPILSDPIDFPVTGVPRSASASTFQSVFVP